MILFSFYEILIAFISAVIYGLIFSFFIFFIDILKWMLVTFSIFISDLIGHLKKSRVKPHVRRISDLKSAPEVFIYILIFTVGMILISYAFLDGCIRAFMIIASIIGLIIGKRIVDFTYSLLGKQRSLSFVNTANEHPLPTDSTQTSK